MTHWAFHEVLLDCCTAVSLTKASHDGANAHFIKPR